MSNPRWFETFVQDVRYGSRVLWRAKAFSSAAIITLALGIGGTTMMFALIQGVLLRPLPVHDQDRLIVSWREAPTSASAQYPFGDVEIELVARASQLLESAAGVTRNGVSRAVVTDGDTSDYANVGLVTGGFFDVLGVQPLFGRTLTRDDERDGAEHVVVISSGLWQRRYGGAPGILGRQIRIGEEPFAVVGVMPPDLDYPPGAEVWRTTRSVPTDGPFGDAARREVNLIARLRPGVSVEQAASELVAINQRLALEAPTDYLLRGFAPRVIPFTETIVGDIRGTMIALFSAVALVLLIASANVANLLLMRGESRRGELALRSALGAGRDRLVRQVFSESLVLSAMAGVLAVMIVAWGLPVLMRAIPEGLPRVESIAIDGTVMLFATAVVFVTGVLAGITPAWLSSRGDLMSVLRGAAYAISGGAATRGRRVLVVAQVALAVMVVSAAGLLIRSVMNLQAIDLGLPPERLAVIDLYLPQDRYAERERRAQFLDQAIAQLEAIPAITGTTPVNVSPFLDRGWDVPRVAAEGQDADAAAGNPSLNLESIHPNYFATLEVPITRGRAFSAADRNGSTAVAIVSEDVAGRLWPNEDPIGKRLKMGPVDSRGRWLEIVGVAAQTRYRTVTAARPTLYLPAAQFQMTATLLIVRSTASLESLTTIAAERLSAIDPNVRVMRVARFTEFLDGPLARPRFTALLLAVFGGIALLLAGVGLYAVIALSVRQRTREIAVRLALGAPAGAVRRLVLSEAIILAGLGTVAGLAGAIAASRALSGMLFEISPLDPVTLASAALLLISAAAVACYAPMRRATRADVVSILRAD